MEHSCEREVDAMHIHHSLPPQSHIIFSVPHKDRILVDSQYTGVQWDKARKYEVWYIYNWISGGAHSSERPCFHWNQNLLQTQKEGILGNTKDRGTLSCPFLVLPPLISQPPACMLSCFSRLRLCNLIDCSLPGPSVHGITQARILEWLAISFQAKNISFSFQPVLILQ